MSLQLLTRYGLTRGAGGATGGIGSTDFSEYTTGTGVPEGWTNALNAATWEVVTDAGFTGSTYIRQTSTTNARRALTWNEAGSMDDTEIVGRVYAPAKTGQLGIAARVSGSGGGTEVMYALAIIPGSNLLRLLRYSSGVEVVGSHSVTLAAETFYMLTMRVEGNRVRGKIDGGSWQIDYTDGSPLPAGGVGLHQFSAGGERWDTFSYEAL